MQEDFNQEGTGVAEGQEGVESQPQEQTIPYKRFEEVYGKMKDYETRSSQYKEFGDPASVKERLGKLAQWEKTIEEHRKQQSLTPPEQAEAQRVAQLRKELEKVYPEIGDVKTLKELREELNAMKNGFSENQAQATLKDMSSRFTDTLKSAKLDTKYQTKIEEYLVSQMSEEERQDFVRGNYEIAERIFNNELKDGLFSAMKARPNLPTPAVRQTPGGTPPKGAGKKATTLAEATDAGWDLIHS